MIMAWLGGGEGWGVYRMGNPEKCPPHKIDRNEKQPRLGKKGGRETSREDGWANGADETTRSWMGVESVPDWTAGGRVGRSAARRDWAGGSAWCAANWRREPGVGERREDGRGDVVEELVFWGEDWMTKGRRGLVHS